MKITKKLFIKSLFLLFFAECQQSTAMEQEHFPASNSSRDSIFSDYDSYYSNSGSPNENSFSDDSYSFYTDSFKSYSYETSSRHSDSYDRNFNSYSQDEDLNIPQPQQAIQIQQPIVNTNNQFQQNFQPQQVLNNQSQDLHLRVFFTPKINDGRRSFGFLYIPGAKKSIEVEINQNSLASPYPVVRLDNNGNVIGTNFGVKTRRGLVQPTINPMWIDSWRNATIDIGALAEMVFPTFRVKQRSGNDRFSLQFNQKYNAENLGSFNKYSIASLRNSTNGINVNNGQQGEIILLSNSQDVSDLQANPFLNGTVFAVASQSISLDGGVQAALNKNKVSRASDITRGLWGKHAVQGERATLVTYPSTAYRASLPIQNRLLFDKNARAYNSHNVCVGVQSNAMPLITLSSSDQSKYRKTFGYPVLNGQRIHQVFLAALNFSRYFPKQLRNSKKRMSSIDAFKVVENNMNRKGKSHLLENGKKLISLQIEGAIRSTIALGSRQLVLTVLGGNAFKNNPYWVLDALQEHNQLIINSGIEVILHNFTTNPATSHFRGEFIKRFGGASIIDGNYANFTNQNNKQYPVYKKKKSGRSKPRIRREKRTRRKKNRRVRRSKAKKRYKKKPSRHSKRPRNKKRRQKKVRRKPSRRNMSGRHRTRGRRRGKH